MKKIVLLTGFMITSVLHTCEPMSLTLIKKVKETSLDCVPWGMAAGGCTYCAGKAASYYLESAPDLARSVKGLDALVSAEVIQSYAPALQCCAENAETASLTCALSPLFGFILSAFAKELCLDKYPAKRN